MFIFGYCQLQLLVHVMDLYIYLIVMPVEKFS